MRLPQLCIYLALPLLAALVPPAAADESDVIKAAEDLLGVVFVCDETKPGRPVVEVVWITQQATNRRLKSLLALKELSQTRKLSLNGHHGARISDAGLVHLYKLDRLQELCLDNTGVTDAGLVHLKKLDRLERLSLNNTAITDAGLKHLKELRRLRSVHLLGTKVTAQGIADLKIAFPQVAVVHKNVMPRWAPWFGVGLPRSSGNKYQPNFAPGR
jgi:hypothetical protein